MDFKITEGFRVEGATASVPIEELGNDEVTAALEELSSVAEARGLWVPAGVGSLALEGTTHPEATSISPELTPEASVINRESLLATLDTAFLTYSFQLSAVNKQRAKVRGRKKPDQLKVVDLGVIRAKVETLISNPDILADLADEADYFANIPETYSPEVGFNIVIVPEGLTDTDNQAIAEDLQARINLDYCPYVRSSIHNDQRITELSGEGFHVVFAPQHYNIPRGDTTTQTKWMKAANTRTTATQLKTATDSEALAQINNLLATGALDDPDTCFDVSYFRRFDQAMVSGFVSVVYVNNNRKTILGISDLRYREPSRALVVPQKLNT